MATTRPTASLAATARVSLVPDPRCNPCVGARSMLRPFRYSGVASGVYDLWDAARDGHNDLIMDSLNSGIDVNDTTCLKAPA